MNLMIFNKLLSTVDKYVFLFCPFVGQDIGNQTSRHDLNIITLRSPLSIRHLDESGLSQLHEILGDLGILEVLLKRNNWVKNHRSHHLTSKTNPCIVYWIKTGRVFVSVGPVKVWKSDLTCMALGSFCICSRIILMAGSFKIFCTSGSAIARLRA